MMHKAGFVNILGKPNVGKSTLMNALLGENLSIITPKAQTTRHRILGIANEENYQIVFSDTPGIIKPGYKLQEYMMGFVHTAIEDADIFLLISQVDNDFDDETILEKLRKTEAPVLLLINKIDLATQDEVIAKCEQWKKDFPNFKVLPISALNNFNLDQLMDKIVEILPESPPYYSKDDLTDRPVRFFISEIVREKILMNYQKEIPYSVEVSVDSFKEEEKIIHIRCVIHVVRDSQKGILIGHQGKALKKIGTEARKDIEKFLGKHVFIDLHVKVSKNWRDNDMQLGRFGYK
ncbi:MAG: GTPase Era [Bacteroidetes bacterium]|nr:MAG: GTPase Era [Bacteroidota bacterium]